MITDERPTDGAFPNATLDVSMSIGEEGQIAKQD
jgi:hypothetical protein